MIDELAKTAFETFYAGSDLGWKWEGQIEKTKECYRRMIRAVLIRMKKPTDGMIEAGDWKLCSSRACECDEKVIFQAMIDYVLQEDKS
jgi:hypothetical protein